jgi:phenylpropionate dioxygenase-like ring-hydroxylating dioxygenase large terminal subunit
VTDTAIACAYHGWEWDGGTGHCVAIPALADQQQIPRNAQLATYKAIERWGLVWTCLRDDPIGEVPNPPELRDVEWVYLVGVVDVAANLLFIQENFRDLAHFPYVHPETIPVPSPVVEPLEPQRNGYEVTLERRLFVPSDSRHVAHGKAYVAWYCATAPNFIFGRWDFGDTTRYLLHCPSPTSLETTRTYYVPGVDWGHHDELAAAMAAETQIYLEDAAIVSTCEPSSLGDALDHQVHTLADRYTLAFRQAFYEYVVDAAGAGDRDSVRHTSVAQAYPTA